MKKLIQYFIFFVILFFIIPAFLSNKKKETVKETQEVNEEQKGFQDIVR